MRTSQPAPSEQEDSPARIATAARVARPNPLWRVAVLGVCRLVDDPERLARLVRARPDATVVRLGTERPV